MIAEAKVRTQDLCVVYPARRHTGMIKALDSVSLSVADGELMGVVGPSGCGKTTLLRVLAGLQPASSGQFVIRAAHANRPTVSLVFQHIGLFPWLTVEQNVAYGLQLRGEPQGQRLAIARQWIAAMGLERFAQAYPGQLSGGMQQRVGLARAFAYNAEVMLMDEPFGALDAQTRMLLQETLLHHCTQVAQTTILVTHSIEEALTLSDRVLVMSASPGRLLHEVVVPFARPRDVIALRSNPQFSSLVAEIWGVLRDEVERARLIERAS